MSDNKRFDNWDEVDCNSCANYWTDKCDGVVKGSKKLCNSFLAQRSIVIPEEIKSLRSALKSLTGAYVILSVIVVAHLIGHICGWW